MMRWAFPLALLLAGCASSKQYQKADGSAPTPQQFELDSTVCKGEAQKANASGVVVTGGGLVGVAANLSRSNAVDDVFSGCMAQRGYLVRKEAQ